MGPWALVLPHPVQAQAPPSSQNSNPPNRITTCAYRPATPTPRPQASPPPPALGNQLPPREPEPHFCSQPALFHSCCQDTEPSVPHSPAAGPPAGLLQHHLPPLPPSSARRPCAQECWLCPCTKAHAPTPNPGVDGPRKARFPMRSHPFLSGAGKSLHRYWVFNCFVWVQHCS